MRFYELQIFDDFDISYMDFPHITFSQVFISLMYINSIKIPVD